MNDKVGLIFNTTATISILGSTILLFGCSLAPEAAKELVNTKSPSTVASNSDDAVIPSCDTDPTLCPDEALPESCPTLEGQLDADGWLLPVPGTNRLKVYVSSSTGNDLNSGFSEVAPLKTLRKARDVVGNNYADYDSYSVLLLRGDTFNDPFGNWRLPGKTKENPALMSSYGDVTKARPVVAPASDQPGLDLSGSNNGNLQIKGLDFKAAPGGVSQVGIALVYSGDNTFIEDVRVQGFLFGLIVQGTKKNVVINRSVIAGNFSINAGSGDHSSGIFADGTDGLVIQESVIDSNGWNPDIPTAGRHFLNHGLYLSAVDPNNKNTCIIGNIVTRNASIGISLNSGGIISNNLIAQNAIGMQAKSTHVVRIEKNVAIEAVDDVAPKGFHLLLGKADDHNNNPGGPATVRDNIFANTLSTSNNSPVTIDTNDGASGKISTRLFSGNKFYNTHASAALSINDDTGSKDSLTLDKNEFNEPNKASTQMIYLLSNNSDTDTRLSFTDNTYSNPLFSLNNSGLNFTNWLTRVNSTGEAVTVQPYIAPTRNIDSYHGSLGRTASIASFMGEAREQSRYNWRSEYKATTVNEYIRQGFEK